MKVNEITLVNLEHKFMMVLRSCHTPEHYLSARGWITRFFSKSKLDIPSNTRLEMYAASRRVVPRTLPKPKPLPEQSYL